MDKATFLSFFILQMLSFLHSLPALHKHYAVFTVHYVQLKQKQKRKEKKRKKRQYSI